MMGEETEEGLLRAKAGVQEGIATIRLGSTQAGLTARADLLAVTGGHEPAAGARQAEVGPGLLAQAGLLQHDPASGAQPHVVLLILHLGPEGAEVELAAPADSENSSPGVKDRIAGEVAGVHSPAVHTGVGNSGSEVSAGILTDEMVAGVTPTVLARVDVRIKEGADPMDGEEVMEGVMEADHPGGAVVGRAIPPAAVETAVGGPTVPVSPAIGPAETTEMGGETAEVTDLVGVAAAVGETLGGQTATAVGTVLISAPLGQAIKTAAAHHPRLPSAQLKENLGS